MKSSKKPKLSIEQQKAFIEEYEQLYDSKSNNKRSDIPKLNTTEKAVEKYIENKLAFGLVDQYVVVWKTGRLKENDIDNDDFLSQGGYSNGYGKTIDGEQLRTYLSELKSEEIKKIIAPSDLLNHRDVLEKCFELAKENVPDNFGSVYLINVLYFLSKKKVPIYDKFAHTAVKALYFEESPSNIYVGDAPSKKDTHKVINMLIEYMWYLNEVFGTYTIERDLDRALWVYGHTKNNKYDFNNRKSL